jgi:hypothetical protein
MTALEQIEKKTGRVHTTHDFRLAVDKAQMTPAALTDEDVAVIEFFGGDVKADKARAARDKANGVPVETPAPTRGAAMVQGVEFPSELWDRGAEDQIAEMKRWSVANAMKVLPLGIWWAFVNAGREKREALEAKIDVLEARIKELEERPTIKYCGVWRDDATYDEGNAVTKSGSLWIARLNHIQSEPGNDGGVGWTLAVKRGRDASRDPR